MKTALKIGAMLCLVMGGSCCLAAEPLIIPHRMGAAELPENTLFALEKLREAGFTLVETDVQLTQDGIVVLYHPGDLNIMTNLEGPVSHYTYEQIRKAVFKKQSGLSVPTLAEALDQFPNLTFIIDFKSVPAEPLVSAVTRMVEERQAWNRVIFYATNDEHLAALQKAHPKAVSFESRAMTRSRLLRLIAEGKCDFESASSWIGFELNRSVEVVEKFQLGEGNTPVTFKMWSQAAKRCTLEKAPQAKVIFFGIDSEEDYKEACDLGAYGVLSNRPLTLRQSIPLFP